MGSGAQAGEIRQVALGISVNPHANANAGDLDQSITAVEAIEDATGRYPAIWAVWSDWGGADKAFPATFLTNLKQVSPTTIPLINWQPTEPGTILDCNKWALTKITAGLHDQYIREWAKAAKAYGGTVLLRFAHEMNGDWFRWGVTKCGNTAASFKAAWKKVFKIFRASPAKGGEGATNVKFVWSPYGTSALRSFYPGNKFVDYGGFTAFNWGPNGGATQRPWASMVKNFKPTVRAMSRVTRKPLIAAEMGAAYLPGCSVCNKPAWVKIGYPAVYAKWPRIAAIVYFDIDLRSHNQPNWRLDSPAGALAEYKIHVLDPRFQGVIP